MSNSWYAVTIDCHDAPTVAQFWANVLSRDIASADSDADHVVLPPSAEDTHAPRVVFNNVPEAKVVKNRVHLDIATTSFAAEAERIIGLGATRLRDLDGWSTFSDVEGNEFDLIDGS